MKNTTKPYAVTFREEGKGKPTTTRFASLLEAQTYIRDRWQGADYMDGPEGFHTDYSSYTLEGFTLKDIGKTSYAEGFREYTFADLEPKAAAPAAAVLLPAGQIADDYVAPLEDCGWILDALGAWIDPETGNLHSTREAREIQAARFATA